MKKEFPILRFTSTRAGRAARTLLVLILLMLALVPAAALAAPLAVPTIDTADARAMPLGSTVTVKGSVTVPSGVFSSSTGDQGFAIQDHTGGIYVNTAANADDVDTVVVEGKVLMRDGRVLTLNIDKLRADVAKLSAEIKAEFGAPPPH